MSTSTDKLNAELTQRYKNKVEVYYDELVARDPDLCNFSHEGRFCDRLKVSILSTITHDNLLRDTGIGLSNMVNCFCVTHQKIARYILVNFDTDTRAENFARDLRSRGYIANCWQGRFVIIGPTSAGSRMFDSEESGARFEAMMYEDVLITAINKLGLDLSHIVGRGSRQ